MLDKPTAKECRSCRFWTGKEAPAGECRRMPPISSSIHHGEVLSAAQPVWPFTNADDWCGEWQMASAKSAQLRPQ